MGHLKRYRAASTEMVIMVTDQLLEHIPEAILHITSHM